MEARRRILEEQHYCHQCDCDTQVELREELQKDTIKGITINTLVNVLFCANCGSEIYIAKINDDNLDKINYNYRIVTGRILVSEIEQLLEMYNIGAKPLSLLLGWGECTIPRYLSGQMPNVENSEKLKSIIRNPYVFYELFNKNKHKLTNIAQKKVEGALANYDVSAFNEENEIAENSLIQFYSKNPNIYNGMKTFELKKLVNSILYFANLCREVYITKMNKLLWYSDMLCFKRSSFSITGLQYQRINYGPVPLKYYWIYGSLSETYFNLEITESGTKIQTFREFDESIFSKEELQALFDVGQKFKNWYAGELSGYSHNERAYIETNHRELIPFSYAKELSIN